MQYTPNDLKSGFMPIGLAVRCIKLPPQGGADNILREIS